MAAALNDFAAALRDLNEAGVRYVIIGGLAVIRHGAVRATKDVDAAIATDGDNLARLEKLVARWQATNPDGSPLRTTKLTAGGVLPLEGIATGSAATAVQAGRRAADLEIEIRRGRNGRGS